MGKFVYVTQRGQYTAWHTAHGRCYVRDNDADVDDDDGTDDESF